MFHHLENLTLIGRSIFRLRCEEIEARLGLLDTAARLIAYARRDLITLSLGVLLRILLIHLVSSIGEGEVSSEVGEPRALLRSETCEGLSELNEVESDEVKRFLSLLKSSPESMITRSALWVKMAEFCAPLISPIVEGT